MSQYFYKVQVLLKGTPMKLQEGAIECLNAVGKLGDVYAIVLAGVGKKGKSWLSTRICKALAAAAKASAADIASISFQTSSAMDPCTYGIQAMAIPRASGGTTSF